MHTGRMYPLGHIITWTRRETAIFVLIAAIPTTLFVQAGWTWLTLPWQPVAIIGTAVSFMTGFKNNASYARTWEARQIWGTIINASRALALLLQDLLPPEAQGTDRRRLLYRHLGWVTALRFQLRQSRTWENLHRSHNVEYLRNYRVAEFEQSADGELAPFLQAADLESTLAVKARASHLLRLQGRDLRQMRESGMFSELEHLELEQTLITLMDAQGRCERIKNFPYPRQFATLNLIFVWLLIVLMPFALLPEFHKLGPHFAWLTIPASTLISWIFHTMDKIGEGTENPFEGGPNDVPITALARTIEIDIREALGESPLPGPLEPVNQILT